MNPRHPLQHDEEMLAAYEQEALQRYAPEIVKASWQRWRCYSEKEKARIMAESYQVTLDLAEVMATGAESEAVQGCMACWHANMAYFWSPTDEQLVFLADGYSSDERFKANFDKIHPDLAFFINEAIRVYVSRRSGNS